jgi:hypothetical protein
MLIAAHGITACDKMWDLLPKVAGAQIGGALRALPERRRRVAHGACGPCPHERSNQLRSYPDGRLYRLGEARPGSLDFFLIERYCLYSARGDALYRARIFHRPWPLHKAHLWSLRSTMIESQGLPSPKGEPVVHQQGEPLRVGVWPPVRVR